MSFKSNNKTQSAQTIKLDEHFYRTLHSSIKKTATTRTIYTQNVCVRDRPVTENYRWTYTRHCSGNRLLTSTLSNPSEDVKY